MWSLIVRMPLLASFFTVKVEGERSVSEIQFQQILLGAFFFCDGDNRLDHPAFKLIP